MSADLSHLETQECLFSVNFFVVVVVFGRILFFFFDFEISFIFP